MAGGMGTEKRTLVCGVWQGIISPYRPTGYVQICIILWQSDSYPLPIIASSVAVERVFSKGRLIMSHIRNRLSADSSRALMCLGAWTRAGYVETADLKHAASLPDAKDDEPWPEDNWIVA